MHIEQYVVNSRPILCIGSSTGEIAVYYLDEPDIGYKSRQPGQSKSKQHLLSQFNFF